MGASALLTVHELRVLDEGLTRSGPTLRRKAAKVLCFIRILNGPRITRIRRMRMESLYWRAENGESPTEGCIHL